MLLVVEKAIRGGIYHSIHQYAKANNKYMKDYGQHKESSYLQNWHVNNLNDWANNFDWVKIFLNLMKTS